MLSDTRAGADTVEVPSVMVVEVDMSGKFQDSRPLKYHKQRGDDCIDFIYSGLIGLWVGYVLVLVSLSLVELGQTGTTFRDPVATLPVFGNTSWTAMNAVANFWAFCWAVHAIWAACDNANTVRYTRITGDRTEGLPHPPLRQSVAWNLVIFSLWTLADAFAAQVSRQAGSMDSATQAAWFVSTMWVTLLVGVITTLGIVCEVARAMLDWTLAVCHSTCYDC